MRRLIALAAGLMLLAACQAAGADYGPAGYLTLSTSQVAAGGTLTVSGSGFAASSGVKITIESTPALLGSVTTDSGGAFSAQVTIPASYSGQHTLVATGTDAKGSVRILSAIVTVGAQATHPPVSLSDGIVAGVDRGTSGFRTRSVILPKPGYVTYLVRVGPAFAGKRVAIYTRSKNGTWVYVTGRTVAANGTVHYYRRITAWTGFWAKLDGASSHGRVGTVR